MIIHYLISKDIIDNWGGILMVIRFDERIKALRLSRDMTQTELARLMTVTRSSVNAWEMGVSVPTAAKLVELSLFFHVSADYLLGLKQEETVTLDRLDSEQKAIIYSLLLHFEKENCQRGG